MKNAKGISRRKLLLLSGGLGGALLAMPGLSWLDSIWQDQEKTLHSRLITLFQKQRSARVIGRTYLERYPQDADSRVLVKKVVADASEITSNTPRSGTDRLRNAGDSELLDVLQRRIRQDFVEEKVVKLQGWILSATEARLCALTALA